LCFQNFAEWYQEHYVEGFQCDKDLKVVGNKVYSADTCIFVSPQINSLMVDCRAARGLYPQGVSLHNESGRFRAKLWMYGKQKHLGAFDTAEEAQQTYAPAKLEYVHKVAQAAVLAGDIAPEIAENIMIIVRRQVEV
jgi:hypothetical protein